MRLALAWDAWVRVRPAQLYPVRVRSSRRVRVALPAARNTSLGLGPSVCRTMKVMACVRRKPYTDSRYSPYDRYA